MLKVPCDGLASHPKENSINASCRCTLQKRAARICFDESSLIWRVGLETRIYLTLSPLKNAYLLILIDSIVSYI